MKGTLQKRQSVICRVVRSNLITYIESSKCCFCQKIWVHQSAMKHLYTVIKFCGKYFFSEQKKKLSLLCASLYILILLDELYTKAFRSSSYPTRRHVKLCLTVDRAFTRGMIRQNILCSFMFYW